MMPVTFLFFSYPEETVQIGEEVVQKNSHTIIFLLITEKMLRKIPLSL